MVQEMGETREAMALDCWNKAHEYAMQLPASERPAYLVFHAKGVSGQGAIRQAYKFYKNVPPAILGILVWYVDQAGEAHFRPDLSSPPDVPLHESILSDKSEDQATRVMEKGNKVGVLLS